MKDKLIKEYIPKSEQEKRDHDMMLQLLETSSNLYLRENLCAHFTTSAIILNQRMDEILLGYHLIYQSYGWFGGHNDGDRDFKEVIKKEVFEETGIKDLEFIKDEPLMLDNICVHNHYKNNEYIPDHIHLNLTYFLRVNQAEKIQENDSEHRDLKWFPIETFLNHISEKRMIPVYQKALKIIKDLKKQLDFKV